MLFNSLVLLAAASVAPLGVDARAVNHAPRALKERAFTTSVHRPTPAVQRTSNIATSNNAISLKKRGVRVNKNSAAFVLGKIPDAALTGTYSNGSSSVLTSLELGQEFATPITIGSQNFEVVVDTGSSDTWVVEAGFTCTDFQTGKKGSEADCGFGTTYSPESSFVQTSDENFSIEYGDLESLSGVIGTDTVTLAGVEVKGQTIALVNAADWEGDGTTSGLTGLAYSALTSAYKGTNPNNDGPSTQIEYSPIIQTIVDNNLVSEPIFSLSILRDVSGDAGYLALGGVPPISFAQNFTSTPIIITNVSGYPKDYDFYTININDVVLNGKAVASSGGSSIEYIVDSGTTLNYFPASVANAVNKAFSPAAKYSSEEGVYTVSCSATAPTVAISIAGTDFVINPLDMILDAGDGSCISGITQGDAPYILGDTFQKNVVTVFDVGGVQLHFAPNVDYPSNDSK